MHTVDENEFVTPKDFRNRLKYTQYAEDLIYMMLK
jgi:hypothetical protein